MAKGIGVGRRAVVSLKSKKDAVALFLLALPGTVLGVAQPAIPARPSSRHSAARPGHRAFFLGTRIEEAQERPLPVSGALVQLHPPKPGATCPDSQKNLTLALESQSLY